MQLRVTEAGNRVERRTSSAVRANKDKIELAAKLGWASKGALYVTLGVLALMAAVGEGGAISGGQGVIQSVAEKPFGNFLLVVAGIGFSCYALWRFVQAAVDPEQHDSKGEMIAKRVGWGASGLVHVSLAVASFQMLSGGAGDGDAQDRTRTMWLSSMLTESWGPFVIGALGVFVIVVGLYQFRKALNRGYMDDVRTARMSERERKAFELAGKVGLSARGVVFPIIGYFLIKAAVNAAPAQAKGVGGALHEIAQAGWLPLAIIALGLIAYGMLQFFFARYRTVDVA